MPTQISRDPFARTTLEREIVHHGNSTGCDWCGSFRRDGESLFRYRTASDGGRDSAHRGLFCCKSCHDCYHA